MAADLFATSLLVITIEIKDLAKRWMAKLPNTELGLVSSFSMAAAFAYAICKFNVVENGLRHTTNLASVA